MDGFLTALLLTSCFSKYQRGVYISPLPGQNCCQFICNILCPILKQRLRKFLSNLCDWMKLYTWGQRNWVYHIAYNVGDRYGLDFVSCIFPLALPWKYQQVMGTKQLLKDVMLSQVVFSLLSTFTHSCTFSFNRVLICFVVRVSFIFSVRMF